MSFLRAEITGEDLLEIEPPRASLGELRLTNRLEMVRVQEDVLGVAESLRRIDPGLKLLYDKAQEVYVLYWIGLRADTPGGPASMHEDLVGAYKELDQRIIRLVERIDAQGRGRHDLQTELERLERQRDAEAERRHAETIGPIAERLRFALRKDLGTEGSSVHMSGSRGKHRAQAESKRKGRKR